MNDEISEFADSPRVTSQLAILRQIVIAKEVLYQLTLREVEKLALAPLFCEGCRQPVTLGSADICADEHGKAIHLHCHVRNVIVASRTA